MKVDKILELYVCIPPVNYPRNILFWRIRTPCCNIPESKRIIPILAWTPSLHQPVRLLQKSQFPVFKMAVHSPPLPSDYLLARERGYAHVFFVFLCLLGCSFRYPIIVEIMTVPFPNFPYESTEEGKNKEGTKTRRKNRQRNARPRDRVYLIYSSTNSRQVIINLAWARSLMNHLKFFGEGYNLFAEAYVLFRGVN